MRNENELFDDFKELFVQICRWPNEMSENRKCARFPGAKKPRKNQAWIII